MTDSSPHERQSAETKLNELKRRLLEISDLNAAGSVLNWDQSTYMPDRGAAARGRQGALLRRLAHERFIDLGLAGCSTICDLMRKGCPTTPMTHG
jgi:Zn-dependent M32 family carboxypeptidase